MDMEIKEEPMVIAQFIRTNNHKSNFQREYLDTSPPSSELRRLLQPVETYRQTPPSKSSTLKCSISTQTGGDDRNFNTNFYASTRGSPSGSAVRNVSQGPSSFSSQNCLIKKFNQHNVSEAAVNCTPAVIEVDTFDDLTPEDHESKFNIEPKGSGLGTKLSCIPLRYIQNYGASHPKHFTSREILSSERHEQQAQPQFATRTSNDDAVVGHSNSYLTTETGYSKTQNVNPHPNSILNEVFEISYSMPHEPRHASHTQHSKDPVTHQRAVHTRCPSYFPEERSHDPYASRSADRKPQIMFSDSRLRNDSDFIAIRDNSERYRPVPNQPVRETFVMRQPSKESRYITARPVSNLDRVRKVNENPHLSTQRREFLADSMEQNECGAREQKFGIFDAPSEHIARSSFPNPCRMPPREHLPTGIPQIAQNIQYSAPKSLHRVHREPHLENRVVHKQSSQTMSIPTNGISFNYPGTPPVNRRQMSGYEAMIDTTEIVPSPQNQRFSFVPRRPMRVSGKVSRSQIPDDIPDIEILPSEKPLPKHVQRTQNEVYYVSPADVQVPRTIPLTHTSNSREDAPRRVYILERKVPVNSASHREQLSEIINMPERDIYVENRTLNNLHPLRVRESQLAQEASYIRPAPRDSYAHVPNNTSPTERLMPLYSQTSEKLVANTFHSPERLGSRETIENDLRRNFPGPRPVARDGSHSTQVQFYERKNPAILHEYPNSDNFPSHATRTNDRTSIPNAGIPISTFQPDTNITDLGLQSRSCVFTSLPKEKMETSATHNNESMRVFTQTSDANIPAARFNPRESWEPPVQNYPNFDLRAPIQNGNINNVSPSTRRDVNAPYFNAGESANDTGFASRGNTEKRTSLLQRALEEPRVNSGQHENLLPTILQDFAFTDSSNQSKPESLRPDSRSSANSDCGADWTDDDDHDSGIALKRVQHCTFCRNHGVPVRKFGHVCERKACECVLCKLTVHSQEIMKRQQALWRRQAKNLKGNQLYHQLRSAKKEKLCDKCRNHNEVSEKRGHGGVCPHERCQCELCRLTDKRRRVTKYLQRIRRAKVTSEEMDMIWKEMSDQRLEPPPEPQPTAKEEDIRGSSCGQPVQQFVSCLLPESMSQNEIRHFLYPRPHLPDKLLGTDLNSSSARSVSTDGLNNEIRTSGASNLADGDVGESYAAPHSSFYPLKSKTNERQTNIAENCPVKTSVKDLCMADKKKIVEGKNGSFREFMDYSEQLSENVVASSSVFDPTLNEDNRNRDAPEAVVRCEKTIYASTACDDYGRPVMRNQWPGQNECTDNAMDIVHETHPSVCVNFEKSEDDAMMDVAVNFRGNSDVSQAPVSPPTVSPPTVSPPTVSPPPISPPNISLPPVSPPNLSLPTVSPPSVSPPSVSSLPVSPPSGNQIQASVSPPGNQRREGNQVRRSYVKRRKRKRTQSCTFCQNHGFTIPKPGHKCPYNLCECLLCRLTKIARVVMKHQQALWRHQAREFKKTPLGNLTKLRQVCDKCRNHNLLYKKSGHNSCEFEKCTCPLCTLTDKRRYVMMHLQRIRRAQVTSKALSSDEDSDCDGMPYRKTKLDHKNFDCSEENQSVAAVIDSVTQALKALPPSLQRLTTDLHIDNEQEADATRAGAPQNDMDVLNPDTSEGNQLMEMEESCGSTSGHKLTQL